MFLFVTRHPAPQAVKPMWGPPQGTPPFMESCEIFSKQQISEILPFLKFDVFEQNENL